MSVVRPGVQAVRDAEVDRLAPRVEQLGDQHGGRIRGRVDVVRRAEQLVGGVVVDHQHLAAGFGELTQRAEPVDAGNVDGDHQVGVAAHAARRRRAGGHRAATASDSGRSGRCGEADLDILARVVQHQRQRQARTDRVGVGKDVAHHADRAGGGQQVGGGARVDALARQICVSLRIDRGQRCPQRRARHPAPRRTLHPRHTVRVGVTGGLGTLPNPRQIGVRGAGAGQQFLHVGGGVRHLVEDERQRGREPHPDGCADPCPQRTLGAFQRSGGAGVVGFVLQRVAPHRVVHAWRRAGHP